jgi:hypothetical protein
VNTYDPAARILYVHVCRGTESWAAPSGSGHTHRKLPSGYANRSPRTCLGSGRTARGAGRPQSPSSVDGVDRLQPAQ